MENKNIVALIRNKKNIIIFVEDDFFNGMSELVMNSILDVEVYPIDQQSTDIKPPSSLIL